MYVGSPRSEGNNCGLALLKQFCDMQKYSVVRKRFNLGKSDLIDAKKLHETAAFCSVYIVIVNVQFIDLISGNPIKYDIEKNHRQIVLGS